MTEDALVQDAPPEISEAEARRLARELFGVDAETRSLGSNQDRNFVLRPATGGPLLLKIANPAVGAAELEAQSRAAAHIAARGVVRVPQARTQAGTTARAATIAGQTMHARLLDFLEGATLSGSGHLSAAVVAAMGTLAARVDAALATLGDEPALRSGQWDLRQAGAALAAQVEAIEDAALRSAVAHAAAEASAAVDAVAAHLPQQLIHGDLTDDNVVVGDALTGLPDGVIDLGDLARSWRVGELAITVSSLLHHDGVGLPEGMRAVAAYHAVLPLERCEVEALWPLVVLRAAVLVASAHQLLAGDPGNTYAAENLAHERLILDAATSVPLAVGTALVRAAVGLTAAPLSLPPHAPLVDVEPGDIAVLDFSATSPLLHEGRWLDPDVEQHAADDALGAGARLAVTRFAEPRLTRSRPGAAEPVNVALGIDLFATEQLTLRAPWPGTLHAAPETLILASPGRPTLSITRAAAGLVRSGAAHGAALATGDALGEFTGSVRVHVGVEAAGVAGVAETSRASKAARTTPPDSATAGGAVPESAVPTPEWRSSAHPTAVTPGMAAAWRAVTADPTPLLGLTPADAPEDPTTLMARRHAHLADVQEHYFDEPPMIVRGWREHLIDADGRVYLDVMNNVTSIGHAHPRLVAAVTAQWSLLNTNSRFHYPAIVEFAERLAALLPDGLDHVFLVNSGSEAVDLALRLARAATGRRDILAVREAYHGWTDLTDAVSTSIADNPHALSTRPEWVHTVDAPNTFRGPHADDPGRYARDAVSEVERLAAKGTPVGAFLAETLYGNAGGIALPDGYLAAVYAAVRAHGGVAVADEVQVGYGRLGHWLWGFEQQDVVPDVVAVAKAMGNGHPLGAVITTKEIADSYRTQGYFFSSAGGSPVSSVVGLTVLDVLRDERLQENARDVGDHLKARLEELGTRHPILGTVHGSGFYLGPEFVRDRETREPATEETTAICERLRQLGVLVQPTGDHQNVLKIKPPMVFSRQSADQLVAALERVLSTGW